jgi:hypothetical protein
VAALLDTMAELTSEERDEVMRSPFLLSLYQVRPLITARRHGRVSTLAGPAFTLPSRPGETRPAAEADEARPMMGAGRTRARIQSDERVVEEQDEEVQDSQETAVRPTVATPTTTSQHRLVSSGASGTRARRGAATADVPFSSAKAGADSLALLDRVDEMVVAPGSTASTPTPAPHAWTEQTPRTMPAMALLQRHHPHVHEPLRRHLERLVGGRAAELGDRICTLAEALAGSQSVAEVAQDLQRTLQHHVWGSMASGAPRGSVNEAAATQVTTTSEVGGRELMVLRPASTATLGQQLVDLLVPRPEVVKLYRRIQGLDASRYGQALTLRVQLANLAQLFEAEVKGPTGGPEQRVTRAAPRLDPWNKGRVSSVKDRLFTQVVPGADRRGTEWGPEARRFERRLAWGRRWLALAREFGWGALVMVPGAFPESRWEREVGSEALEQVLFTHLHRRYPGWFDEDRCLTILLAVMSDHQPVGVPGERHALEAWLQGR